MEGRTRDGPARRRFAGWLEFLMFTSWISGKAHRGLELGSLRYRTFNARALGRHSALDRTLAVLDVAAQFDLFPSTGPTTGMGKDLAGVALSDLRLSGTYTRLHKADLRDTILTRAALHDVNLRKSVWQGAMVIESSFHSCSFREASLTPSSTRGSRFEDCDFAKATVAGNFDDAAFVDCSLAGHRLRRCSFERTNFKRCSLASAELGSVNLEGATFENCDLREANLRDARLRGATFRGCDLTGAIWAEADIDGAVVERSEIYGMSLWGTRGELADARALRLTKPGQETALEIDGLHIGVFVVSLLDGNGVRELVDGLSSTLVLVLGRFSPEHKQTLNEIRSGLRSLGYSAIVFDTNAPRHRDTSETVSILAKLSRFVIADLTEPKSAPYELQQFVADGHTPLQVVTRGEPPFSMLSDLEKYPWVLPARQFDDGAELMAALPELVAGLEQLRENVQPAA